MKVEDRALMVTRLEVIGEGGRLLTRRPCEIELHFQDEGRTLKVFVTGGLPGGGTAQPDLRDVLTKLVNEASGFLSMADPSVHGYTNIAVLRTRIEEARNALSQPGGGTGAPPVETGVEMTRAVLESLAGVDPSKVAMLAAWDRENERRHAAEENLQDARRQLVYWWNTAGGCPCGARRESPSTHPHALGCPTARALSDQTPQPAKEA